MDLTYVIVSWGTDVFKFATNWIQLMTALQLILSIWCHASPNAPNFIKGLHHFLFEMIMPGHLLIMTVYWGTLHSPTMEQYAGNYPIIAHKIFCHLAPGVFSLFNFLISDIVIIHRHSLVLVVFGVIYSCVNYMETKARGTPLYWFLDWKDMTSVYIFAAM